MEPLNRRDVEQLIEANGGTAEMLCLVERDMHGASLSEADLHGASLYKADLHGADLVGSDLQEAKMGRANLQNVNLFDANLRGTRFVGADLQQAKLLWANLQDADLEDAKLQGAVLRHADLRAACLTGANLQGANLAGVRISPDTNLEGVNWDKNYVSVLERNGDYEAATALYRRLKEWYRGAGMLKVAGDFHYREEEAITKARWQGLGRTFKERLATAWLQLREKGAKK